MARRHVVQYFLEVENEYLEMVKVVNELKRLVAEGSIPDENYLSTAKDVEIIKANYERLAWIIHLLNLPNKKSKEDKMIEESWYKALQYASKEAIVDETRDALCKIKELVKQGELTENESESN